MKNKIYGSICEKKNAFFIINHKVANTSIVSVLRKHGFSKRAAHKVDLNNFYIFAFVRNPFDRVLSRYQHLQRVVKGLKEGNLILAKNMITKIALEKATKIRHIRLTSTELKILSSYLNLNNEQKTIESFQEFAFVSFAEFTKYIIENYGTENEPHYEIQIDKFERQLGTLDKINYVGRFENLQEDFDIVCKKLNLPEISLSHTNKSRFNPVHYSEFYDNETRQLVEKEYAKDIEYFGYEFES